MNRIKPRVHVHCTANMLNTQKRIDKIIHHFGTSLSTHKSPFNGGYEVMANLYEAINVLLNYCICYCIGQHTPPPLVAIHVNTWQYTSSCTYSTSIFLMRRAFSPKALIRLADGMDVVLMLVSHFDSCFTIRRLDLWPVSYPPKNYFQDNTALS